MSRALKGSANCKMESERLKGHLAMGMAAAIWGMMSPITKLVTQEGYVSAFALASFRLLGGAVLFWLASALIPSEQVEKGDRLKLFYASLFGIVFNQMAFTVGVGFTSPADASIITTITPILTLILSVIVLKEAVTGKKIAGICASAAGAVLLISTAGHRTALPGDNNMLGDLLCLSSQCSVAVYFIFFNRLFAKYSPITLMKWMFTYASAVCLPFTFREISNIPYTEIHSQTWLCVSYVVVLATFFSYICLSYAQRRIKPTAVSMYNYSQPVVASTMAVLWGMDHFGWLKAVSVLLVFAGVFLVTRSNTSIIQEH